VLTTRGADPCSAPLQTSLVVRCKKRRSITRNGEEVFRCRQGEESGEAARRATAREASRVTAGKYTEDRLARIRSAVREAIPGIGASMVVKAVDVLCLQASKTCLSSSNYRATHAELRGELEAQLCESGFGQWQGQHPYATLLQVIIGDNEEHKSRELLQGQVEDTSMGEPKGAGSWLPAGPAPMVVLQAAAAAGDKRRVKTQVGPSRQRGPRALGQNLMAQGVGPNAQGPKVQQAHKGTLGLDLGGRARLSKPRSLGIVDDIMWGEAQQLAIQEIAVLFSVPTDIQLYYNNMCTVGQQALAGMIHIKTQAIYDARSAQKMKREKRKL